MNPLRHTVARSSVGNGRWIIALLLGMAAVLIAAGLAPRWFDDPGTGDQPIVQTEPAFDDVPEAETAAVFEQTALPEAVPEQAPPETLDELLEAYNAALAENDLTAALRHAGAYVKAAPDDPYGYALRGYAHWLRSRCDIAVADMNRAIALASNYGYAYFGRASCLFVTGKLDEAERDARDALIYAQNDDELAYSHELLGWLAYAQGRFGDAIQSFTTVGQGGDGMAQAGLWLAHARMGQDWDGAMALPSGAGENERLVLDILAGRRSRTLLETAARNGGPAAFYLAQLELVEGCETEAVAFLEAYMRSGFSTDMTYPVARAQLRLLR